MLLQNGEIYNAYNALKDLTKRDWSVKQSLALIKLAQDLRNTFDKIDLVRLGLARKYEKEKGLGVKVTDDTWNSFAEEFNELMEENTELDFTKVVLPFVVNGKDVFVAPDIIQALNSFVEFKE